MITTRKLGGGTRSGRSDLLATYFEQPTPTQDRARARDEYYLDSRQQEAAGEWWSPAGHLAQDGGTVTHDAFRHALDGTDAAGNRLVQISTKNERVSGWDISFSAPKSASVAWALADDKGRRGIEQDFKAAITETLAHMHSQGDFQTRRGKGGKVREAAKDVMIARFIHFTSRSGNPQLHAHNVLANVALRQDGRTGALHSPVFHERLPRSREHFLKGFAQKLEARGMAIVDRTDTGFRIEGVPQELEKAWSERRNHVLQRAIERHPNLMEMDAKQRGQVMKAETLASRARKSTIPPMGALEDRWRGQVQQLGFSPEGIWQRVREGFAHRLRPALNDLTARLRQLRLAVRELANRLPGGAQQIGRRLALAGLARAWRQDASSVPSTARRSCTRSVTT